MTLRWTAVAATLMMVASAHAQAVGPSCPDPSIAGITSAARLKTFLGALKKAAAAKDYGALAGDALYPMRLNSIKSRTIRSSRELAKLAGQAFPPKVLDAIQSQSFADLFCRDQGVSIGSGDVWLGERKGRIGIVAINL